MNKRRSGVLLHITSLKSNEGIGTLGKSAYKFADYLEKAKQTLWQVLPLGPTGYGDSPYASFSTFAGNPLLIDLQLLVEKNWAKDDVLILPDYIKTFGNIDYGSVVWWKLPVLFECAKYFLKNASKEDLIQFEIFKKENQFWLDDYASFTSIKNFFDKKAQEMNVTGQASMWNNFWPKDLASHKAKAIQKWNKENQEEIENIKVIQFFFYSQWEKLKSYCNSKNIKIIGDIPIFVAADSSDLWSNQKYFQFDKKTLQQKSCAGVPPDYFSSTGQLWGNPLYNWSTLKKDNFSWWIMRIRNMMKLVDIIRIDHFRAFESYWKIPFGSETAINGKWTKGPGIDLFNAIKAELGDVNIIAEDLGIITKKVEKLRDQASFPGMKILQFAFNNDDWSEESKKNLYLPHNYKSENCVVYTGTHDNDTLMGFVSSAPSKLKENICNYFKIDFQSDDITICKEMIKAAFLSKAKYCIIPLQDIYFLGNETRLNVPSTSSKNWSWRMDVNLDLDSSVDFLKTLSEESGRNE